MGVAQTMMRVGTGVHAKLVKLTGAMGGGSTDGSLLVLTHKGAKSGKVRETPVVFVNHEGGYAVARSVGGAPKNPGWYRNLKAHPDTTVNVARRDVAVTARQLEGDEYQAVWERFSGLDERWEHCRQRTERAIPLMHLRPR